MMMRNLFYRRRTGWWFGCFWLFVVVGLAQGTPRLALTKMADGLTSPVALAPFPDDSGRLLVVDQIGKAHVITSEGTLQKKPFLDLRGRLADLNQGFDERGFLGVAFHPEFAVNGRFFVRYSAPLRGGAPTGWDHTSYLSEFRVKDSGEVDPESERLVLAVDQPQFNHNSGALAFGPDGYLYVAFGDGGNANDRGKGHSPQGNAQDLSNLLGTVLRLDVNGKLPYGIPNDNPLVGGRGRPEIYAYGLRNPWGMSFDLEGENELFLGDVGQNAFEEVNVIVKGGNYGWNVREGFHCFDPDHPNQAPADCPDEGDNGKPFVDPILEYKNFKAHRNDPAAKGICVVGGYVYRGKAIPELVGRYVFADWTRNWILPQGVLFVASRPEESSQQRWAFEPLPLANQPEGTINAYITALGQDRQGELYVLTNDSNAVTGETGKVYKLVRAD